MIYIGIDPGPDYVAWAMIIDDNYPVHRLMSGTGRIDECFLSGRSRIEDGKYIAVEVLECFGMPIGKSTIETAYTIGAILDRFRGEVLRITKNQTQLCLCRTTKAKDANMKRALKDIYGEPGTKKNPGGTYGFKNHTWDALAVAHTLKMMVENEEV